MASKSTTTQTIVDQEAGWTKTLSFAPFDPTLGTLQDVQVTINGDIVGTIAVENLDAAGATVITSLNGGYAVSGPGSFTASTSSPSVLQSSALSAFDGVIDDKGASGSTTTNTGMAAGAATDTTSLASYETGGNVAITITNSAALAVAGSANLQISTSALAGAVVGLTYDYTAAGATSVSTTVKDVILEYIGPVVPLAGPPVRFTSYQTFTVPEATTGFTDLLSVQKFAKANATLVELDIIINGDVNGSVAVENTGTAAAAAVSVMQAATISVLGVNLVLSNTDTGTLQPYDGTTDFQGSDSRTDTIPTVTGQQTGTITDPAVLAPFIGTPQNPSTNPVAVSTTDSSAINGPAALQSLLHLSAGATVQFRYGYTSGVACFASGTRVATTVGDVAVEHLAVGAVVRARSGDRPVVWIGQRTVACDRHPDPASVMPVRVRAGAFGPASPARDLVLSPDHALFLDGVLIPVRCLIDGEAVRQIRTDRVTYFHVELDAHDVLFAENLPAESYLAAGNRSAFANAGMVYIHPDFAPRLWEADACAPLVVAGPHVAAARALLARRSVEQAASRDQPDVAAFVFEHEMAGD